LHWGGGELDWALFAAPGPANDARGTLTAFVALTRAADGVSGSSMMVQRQNRHEAMAFAAELVRAWAEQSWR
jgi:hypothetical protein